jgi:hypothetical protein
MSYEFDELTTEGGGYLPVVEGSTSAIFRHGYSARHGIYTLLVSRWAFLLVCTNGLP